MEGQAGDEMRRMGFFFRLELLREQRAIPEGMQALFSEAEGQ